MNSDSTCVRRVRNLSGGNYWGKVTNNGIADSVKEIFRNYAVGFGRGGIRIGIHAAIPEYSENGIYNYFRI